MNSPPSLVKLGSNNVLTPPTTRGNIGIHCKQYQARNPGNYYSSQGMQKHGMFENVYELDINVYNFKKLLSSTGFVFYKVTSLKKCDIILHIFDQIKSFKGSVVSRTLLSLHGESREIMLTVPLMIK